MKKGVLEPEERKKLLESLKELDESDLDPALKKRRNKKKKLIYREEKKRCPSCGKLLNAYNNDDPDGRCNACVEKNSGFRIFEIRERRCWDHRTGGDELAVVGIRISK